MCCARGPLVVSAASTQRRRATVTLRPTPAEKQQLALLARHRGLSEAQLALGAVRSLLGPQGISLDPDAPRSDGPPTDRITIRLRPGDRQAIRLRALGRGMHDSAYLAALARAHVTVNPPLSADELRTLKEGIAALRRGAALLGQLAADARARGESTPQLRDQLPEFRQRIEELEQQFRAFALAALKSWETRSG